MKFLDFGGEPINVKLAAQFTYKGLTISASTIFTPYASIAILDAEGEFLATELNSVEEAIALIDNGTVG